MIRNMYMARAGGKLFFFNLWIDSRGNLRGNVYSTRDKALIIIKHLKAQTQISEVRKASFPNPDMTMGSLENVIRQNYNNIYPQKSGWEKWTNNALPSHTTTAVPLSKRPPTAPEVLLGNQQ